MAKSGDTCLDKKAPVMFDMGSCPKGFDEELWGSLTRKIRGDSRVLYGIVSIINMLRGGECILSELDEPIRELLDRSMFRAIDPADPPK